MKPCGAAIAAGVAVCWGCVVAVGAYAVVRAVHFFAYLEPDPATVAWSAHAGFFWRCWTCAYAGGIGSFVAYLGTRAHFELSVRALAPAIALAAALLVAQVTLLP
jgi:hypothetical protein